MFTRCTESQKNKKETKRNKKKQKETKRNKKDELSFTAHPIHATEESNTSMYGKLVFGARFYLYTGQLSKELKNKFKTITFPKVNLLRITGSTTLET